MKAILILLFMPLAMLAQPVFPPAFWAPPSSSVVATGIVGQVFSDDFERASLGTDWKITGLTAYITNSSELFVHGVSAQTSLMEYTNGNWQTMSENWEVRWAFSNEVADANSPGAGVGVRTKFTTLNRSYFGLFSGDTGTDGRKAILYLWDGTTWNVVAKSAQVTYSVGNIVDCILTRSNEVISFAATNRANGLGNAVSATYSYVTTVGTRTPGPTTIGVWCFKGDVHIQGIVMTNTSPWPCPLVVVGDSITEGYNATNFYQGYEGMLRSNKNYQVYAYAAASAATTNLLICTNELARYKPTRALMMIGGNDIQYGETLGTVENNYTNIVNLLVANGTTVYHCLPTPRTATSVVGWMQFLTNQYPTAYIDTYTPLTNGTTGLNPIYNDVIADGVHPNIAGHLVVFQTITNSGKLP